MQKMQDVLVVDDQKPVRTYIMDMINEMKLDIGRIFEASDGMEALEAVRGNKPEIILVDIMMPRLDGLEFIREIREEKIESHIIIMSAHQDFRYAKKAINYKVDDYLLKPVLKNELYSVLLTVTSSIQKQKQISSTVSKQEEHYRSMLLTEYLTGKDIFINVQSLLKNAGILPEHTFFTIALLQTEKMEAEEMEAIRTELAYRLELKGYAAVSCFNGVNELICIISLPEHGDQAFIDEMTRFMPNNLVKKSSCGLSAVLPGVHSLRELYRQAHIAVRECVYRGCRIMSYSEIKKNPQSLISSRRCDEILGLLENGIRSELDRRLEELFIKLNKENYSICEIENSMLYLVEYLYLHLTEDYPEICDIEAARSLLHNAKKIFNIKVEVKQIIDAMFNNIRRHQGSDNPKQPVDYLLEYIKTNFHKDISLSQAANELSMNYSYISNLFTIKVGRTFSDYLMQYRLEKSKKLLLDSRDKIHDIAGKCGYSNTKYFFKVFKEQTGHTPGEYRELYSKQKYAVIP